MAVTSTVWSRGSFGYHNSGVSLAGRDTADTGFDLSAKNFNAEEGFAIGSGDTVTSLSGFVAFSTGTAAVSLGAINPLESSSVVTVGLSNATRGDSIWLTLDSIYQDVAANRDVSWHCSSSSTVGEVNVWGINSTLTAVTPTANTVIRLTRINHPSYI